MSLDFPTTGAYTSFERLEPYPLDASSSFDSVAKMANYVNTDPSVYESQLISVIDETVDPKVYKLYVVAKDNTGFNPILLMTNTGNSPVSAVDVGYDNTVTNLTAKNIQAAIDEISLHRLREIIIDENKLTVGDYRHGETLRYNHNFYMCKNTLGTKEGTDVSGDKFKNEFEMLIMVNAENIFFDNNDTNLKSTTVSDCIKELSLHTLRELLLTPDDKVIGDFKTNETVIFKDKLVVITKENNLDDGTPFTDNYITGVIEFSALDISFDNKKSKLTSIDVQAAIDELSLKSFRQLIVDNNNLTTEQYRKNETVIYKGNLYSVLIDLSTGVDLTVDTDKIIPILEFKTDVFEIKNIENKTEDIIYKMNQIIEYNNLLFRLTDSVTIKTTSNKHFFDKKEDSKTFIKDDIVTIYDERKMYIATNDSIDSVTDIHECLQEVGYGLYKNITNDASLSTNIKYSGSSPIGGIQPNDILPKGMTFTEFVKKMLSPIIPPIYKKPSLSFNIKSIQSPILSQNNIDYYEAGTIIDTVKINGNFIKNDGGALGGGTDLPGKYEIYLSKGNTVNFIRVANEDVLNENENGALIDNYDLSVGSYMLSDNNSVNIKCVMYYTDGPIKNDNNGEPYPIGQIKAGNLSIEKTIKSSRYTYFGTLDNGGIINESAKVKLLPEKKFNLSENSIITIKCIPNVTKQIAIAYPKFDITGKEIRDIKDIVSKDMGGSILDLFEKNEIEVEGASPLSKMIYKVFHYISPVTMAGEDEYTITI